MDVVIVDGEGKIVKRYQCKYGQDSHATGEMFEKGDYRGQGKLIPDGQEIEKKSSNVIEAPDGTTSKPLSKEKAKQMQEEAQSGNWSELNWNEYQVKDLAIKGHNLSSLDFNDKSSKFLFVEIHCTLRQGSQIPFVVTSGQKSRPGKNIGSIPQRTIERQAK